MKYLLLIMLVFASDENENVFESDTKFGERNGATQSIVVKIEEDEYVKKTKKTSNYIGVSYNKRESKWGACRWSKKGNKTIHNGIYKNEETAAHASDTLARKLIENGEKNHKLNFPDNDTEVYPEEVKYSSNYIGVSYNKKQERWIAWGRCKNERKTVYNGYYKDEERAAHASDTLARKLIANGEKGHKLNFPDDDTEVYREKITNYIGVNYNKSYSKWVARRWSRIEEKMIYNGYYKNEETAAHASDTLARKLIENGEKCHKLNFPDNKTEVSLKEYQQHKRKRQANLKHSQDK